MKKLCDIAIIICIVVLLSSCTTNESLGERAIVKGILVDTAKDKYEASLIIYSCTPTSQIAEIKENANVYTAQGDSIMQAIQNAEKLQNKKPFYAQNQLLFLSKAAANEHLDDIVMYFSKEDSARPSMSVILTDKSAKQFNKAKTELPKILSNAEAMQSSQAGATKQVYELYGKDGYFGYLPMFTFGEKDGDFVGLKEICYFQNSQIVGKADKEEMQLAFLLSGAEKKLSLSNIGDDKINFSADGLSLSYEMKNNSKLCVTLNGNIRSVACEKKQAIDKNEAKAFKKIINEYISEKCNAIISKQYENANDVFSYKWWFMLYDGAISKNKILSSANISFVADLKII